MTEETFQGEWLGYLPELEAMGEMFSGSTETTLEDLNEAWRLEHGEAVKAAKEFEKYGLVKFIVGRHGKPTRVKWLMDPGEIVDAIKGPSEMTIVASRRAGETARKGRTVWDWDSVLDVLADKSGCLPSEILIDVKIGPLKRNLASLHDIETEAVDVRIGY